MPVGHRKFAATGHDRTRLEELDPKRFRFTFDKALAAVTRFYSDAGGSGGSSSKSGSGSAADDAIDVEDDPGLSN
jgi:hypothetical protein